MSRKVIRLLLVLLLVGGLGAYYVIRARTVNLTLTGVVTTHDVIVSAQVPGQISALKVQEGDTVTAGQLVAEIAPGELAAERAYYAETAQGASSAVSESLAALRYEEQQTASQVQQAEAAVAAAEAARQSGEADLEQARLTWQRNQRLVKEGVVSVEQFDESRTTYDSLTAHVAALAKQVDSAKAALATAQANAEQVAMRRSSVETSRSQSAAAAAQRQKADIRLAYTEVRAPIAGIVQVRAARQGEVVAVGQPIVTIIDPDDLWVRIDVEESYIDRIHMGDHLPVRLPSGDEVQGTVFYRGIDAGFATQRDVSRTKRDIKAFEVRLRVDNHDRRLAVGMTTYVPLTFSR
jgi:multidrug resistance efflux pump